MDDREKLIELVSEAKDKDWTNCNDHPICEGCPYEDVRQCHDSFIADYLLANGVTFGKDTNVTSKWIPVTERLPICGERVLMTDGIAVFEGYLSISHKWVRYEGFMIFDATHWMPLPAPPKGE